MIFAAFPFNLTSSLSVSGLFTGGRRMTFAKSSSQTVRPSGDFAPKRVCTHRVRTHIDSPSDQVLKKIIFLLPSKKDNIVAIKKQPHTRHVYFSFEKESLWWVQGYVYTNSVTAKRTFYLMGQACCDQRFFSWLLIPNIRRQVMK